MDLMSITPPPNAADQRSAISALKAKSPPQRPGPSGSRVVKKKVAPPRLGDGLLGIFTESASIPAPGLASVARPLPEAPSTLTRSNLSRLPRYGQRERDILLDSASDQSEDDDAPSSLSFRSRGTSQYGYTPPTTLSAGDSDEESTTAFEPNESPSRLAHRRKCANMSPVPGVRYQPKSGTSNADTHSPTEPVSGPNPIDLEHVAAVALEAPTSHGGAIPDTESLHGIVRSFFAVERNLNGGAPTAISRQTPESAIPNPAQQRVVFWNAETIFDFYVRGAITPQKAKETARRHGLLDAIPIIEHAEELKARRPSPSQSKASVPNIDSASQRFMQKLSSYMAEDEVNGAARPLHVFVDMSNIFIGFCNSYKISQNIPIHQYIRAPTFNVKVLTSIMLRNRAASKKILAGSVAITASAPASWPRYFVDAQGLGYDMKIMNRVQKISPNKSGRRRNKSPLQVADAPTSGDESTEDQIATSFVTRNGEQGVDEILHLNMMNSILDCIEEPATMILATGDAAQAEFSEGFLEYATRALSKGWSLELVTWKKTISSAWMNPAFRKQYGRRFRIVYLDEFLDELNADLCPTLA
ncbi:hypothetical protein F5Y17DRAFT_466305 [Xylariaceae sp. FL0594]|nr:hypothetical protein F5Y17DRAFT_466305 [Xylariaceae sp. FL0594]